MLLTRSAAVLALSSLLGLLSPSAVLALQNDDVPSACRDACSSSISLLNSCGLATDGSNANNDNMNCFCPNMDHSGYDDCTRCVRDNDGDYNDNNNNNNDYNDDGNNIDDDNDNDDYRLLRMRSVPRGPITKRMQQRRDVLSQLLNVGNTLCTVDGVVSAATSLVGQVVTDVNSVVTQVLGNGDNTRTGPTSTRYDETTTVYATQTVSYRNAAAGRFALGQTQVAFAIAAALAAMVI